MTSTRAEPAPLRVLYFARARELAGRESEALPVPAGATLREVRAAISARHPALGRELGVMRLAVNQVFAEDGEAVPPGAEVAVIPPVSGGAPDARVALVHTPIAADEAARRLGDEEGRRGALATFAGMVRAWSVERHIAHLDYEAYEPMALGVMSEIAREARQRWPVLDVAVVHRLGRLELGEVAVSIAVSSMHRAEAFEACRYVIEELKQRVPIWKRETATDGEQWWGRGP